MIWGAALTLLAVLILLTGVLAVPMEIRFRAEMEALGRPFQRSATLRWGFVRASTNIALRGGPRPAVPKAKTRAVSPPSRVDMKRLLTNPAFWSEMKRLFGRLLGTVECRLLRLRAEIGLDDPADTGQLVGLLSSVLSPLTNRAHTDLTFQPVFDGQALALRGEARIRLIPLRVLWVIVTFAVRPSTWRVLRPALRRGQGSPVRSYRQNTN